MRLQVQHTTNAYVLEIHSLLLLVTHLHILLIGYTNNIDMLVLVLVLQLCQVLRVA